MDIQENKDLIKIRVVKLKQRLRLKRRDINERYPFLVVTDLDIRIKVLERYLENRLEHLN